MRWFLDPMENHYLDFEGRTSRKEFWMFMLYSIILYIGAVIADIILDIGAIISLAFSLAIVLPSISITFRRLHDVNMSAWWILLGIIPFIGSLILLYFYIKPGDTGPNKYGQSPLGTTAPAEDKPAPAPTESEQVVE